MNFTAMSMERKTLKMLAPTTRLSALVAGDEVGFCSVLAEVGEESLDLAGCCRLSLINLSPSSALEAPRMDFLREISLGNNFNL
jgi:hypothetical protein